MTDAPKQPPDRRDRTRDDRLRDALRQNLKRRKSQSRGRVDRAAMPAEASSGPPIAPSSVIATGQRDTTANGDGDRSGG